MWYGAKTERRTEILSAVDKKVTLHEPSSFISGEEKRASLLASKVVLVVHAYDGPSYEPFRYVEAASCGTLIVAETPSATDGWIPGTDFVSAPSAFLADAA